MYVHLYFYIFLRTYPHNQLPTLYFAIIMLAHLLDHFIFSSRLLAARTKTIIFGICSGSIILTFWWFKGVAFGIDGPISQHGGLLWRKVSAVLSISPQAPTSNCCRAGIYI